MRKFKLKEKDVRSILNRLKWDPTFDFSLVEVLYIDRPRGISRFFGGDIEDIGHKFIYLGSIAIPMHRVVEIRYDGKAIWRKGNERGEEQTREGNG
ncbi:MAG: DUF504 domain-containing protein [Archaeoglobales archaeon]|nr:MAG: DUF504 domain-containing protein [Archaeoglobales archaeon]